MSILSWLLDLLYPPKCVVCGKLLTVKAPVCPHCLDALPEFDGAAPSVRFTSGGAVSFFYEVPAESFDNGLTGRQTAGGISGAYIIHVFTTFIRELQNRFCMVASGYPVFFKKSPS